MIDNKLFLLLESVSLKAGTFPWEDLCDKIVTKLKSSLQKSFDYHIINKKCVLYIKPKDDTGHRQLKPDETINYNTDGIISLEYKLSSDRQQVHSIQVQVSIKSIKRTVTRFVDEDMNHLDIVKSLVGDIISLGKNINIF